MNTAIPAGGSEQILGLPFFTGALEDACEIGRRGGLVLAPSGPGLAGDLTRERAYRAALENADVLLTDSSYLVLAWRLRTGRIIPRHSGLACLRCFLATPAPKPSVYWVMPSVEEWQRNAAWLNAAGWPVEPEDGYIAPQYEPGKIHDAELCARIERKHPDVIMIAIGGGTQERLGHGLREALSYRPGIFCLGAAIAFLAGGQVAIPRWVDKTRLGWLWRIVSNPRRYGPRYLKAIRLGLLVLRYAARAPADR